MFDYHLFLGFPINAEYGQELKQIPEAVRSLFIQGGDYLQTIEIEGISYLGKSLGECLESPSLELAQAHILSVLKRLVPSFPYNKDSLVLLAVQTK